MGWCQDTDQGTVQFKDAVQQSYADNNYYTLKKAVKHVLRFGQPILFEQTALTNLFRNDFDINATQRSKRQIDRTDALLGGYNIRDKSEYPLQEATGEKTRKTYDFTKTFHVGTSCHDIQANQGTLFHGCCNEDLF